MSGATVQLNESSGVNLRSVTSDKDGSFHFDDLNPTQDYQIRAVCKALAVELRVEEARRSAKP